MKDKALLILVMLALVLAGCASAKQAGGSRTGNDHNDTGNLSLLLRQATSEIQKWGDGNSRNVKVYSLDYAKKDKLFQAVQEAGFNQVGTGEGPRDWDLGKAVLRWCVSPNIDKWPNEIQVSVVGEKTVYTYFFKSLQDSPFTDLRAAVEIQKWGDGNNRRDVTVYSFDSAKKDELFQAVEDAGFYQAWTGEYTRDGGLQIGVLRWCVPGNTEKWDREIQVSAVGEKTVHTYGFKPLPDVYFIAVENSTFPKDSRVQAIAYGGGKFLAGTSDGKMAYSADGVIWTAINGNLFGINNIEIGIAYGGGKFAAVGSDGGMAYSADGVIWTAFKINMLDGYGTDGIVYGGGKFVATFYRYGGVGVNGWKRRVAYSTDGVAWTLLNDYREDLGKLGYGGGRFVSGSNGRMAYSSDGVTWTESATGVLWVNYPNGNNGGGGIGSIAYGGGKFVAVGGAYNGSWHNRVAYSTDGETWTLVEDSSMFGNSSISAIAYGGGKFVAHSWDKMAYSTDGVIWTAVENSPLYDVNAIVYGGGMFVGVGREGKIAYSNKME
jgi:hypothetical protein